MYDVMMCRDWLEWFVQSCHGYVLDFPDITFTVYHLAQNAGHSCVTAGPF